MPAVPLCLRLCGFPYDSLCLCVSVVEFLRALGGLLRISTSSASAGGNSRERELLARDPSHLLSELRAPARRRSSHRMKCSSTTRSSVGVGRREHLVADARADAELLAQLAREAVGVASRPARTCRREIPSSPSRCAPFCRRVTRNASVALDDGGRDDERHLARSRSGVNGIGAAASSPSGRRGTSDFAPTQTIAPKSISAWLKSKTWRAGHERRRDGPQVRLHRVALRIAACRRTRERARARRWCRESRARWPNAKLRIAPAVYAPMPLNESSVSLVVRQLAAVARDRLARDRLQAARPDVVAERVPGRRHVALGRRGQRIERRVLLEPLGVLRQHAVDLRLLQHDLRDEDVVRVGRCGATGRSRPCRRYQASSRVPEPAALGGAGSGAGGSGRGGAMGFVRRRFAGISYNSAGPVVKIYTRTGDAGRDVALRRHARRQERSARRRVRRGRRAERLARPRPRREGSTPTSTPSSSRIQRDLFALGAQLADPADKIADRVTKAALDRRGRRSPRAADRSPRGRTAAAAPLHSAPAAARPAPRCTSPGPSAAAPSGGWSRSTRSSTPLLLRYVNRLSDLLFVLARAVNHRAALPETEW